MMEYITNGFYYLYGGIQQLYQYIHEKIIKRMDTQDETIRNQGETIRNLDTRLTNVENENVNRDTRLTNIENKMEAEFGNKRAEFEGGRSVLFDYPKHQQVKATNENDVNLSTRNRARVH